MYPKVYLLFTNTIIEIQVIKKIKNKIIVKILLKPEAGKTAGVMVPVFIGKNSAKIKEMMVIIKRFFSACWFWKSAEKSAENKKHNREINLQAKQVLPMKITKVEYEFQRL